VVLASRSGPAAAEAAGLAAQLAAVGTSVEVAGCDIADRDQVAGLIAGIDAGGPPLTAVMHTAGVLDDGVIDGLDTSRLASVLAPKASGAALLDELTAGRSLAAFVLFSSVAATLGGAAQGNYAAANAFLDALAEQRLARGLAATSVAWGPWAGGGMSQVSEAVRQRLRRSPLPPMDPDLALKALGQVLDGGDQVLAIVDVDWAKWLGADQLPFLRDLPEVRRLARDSGPRDGTAAGASWSEGALARQLADVPQAEQARMLTDLVQTQAAAVLGHPSAEAVPFDQAFSDLGFDSLTAVELRNLLSAATGLRLPATLVFDYPTSAVLADHLRAEICPAGAETAAPVFAELEQLEAALADIPAGSDIYADVTVRLQTILSKWISQDAPKDNAVGGWLQEATAGEVLDFIDKEFGVS
jgi:acyl carrier protein/short-subunit dehydrogenase